MKTIKNKVERMSEKSKNMERTRKAFDNIWMEQKINSNKNRVRGDQGSKSKGAKVRVGGTERGKNKRIRVRA